MSVQSLTPSSMAQAAPAAGSRSRTGTAERTQLPAWTRPRIGAAAEMPSLPAANSNASPAEGRSRRSFIYLAVAALHVAVLGAIAGAPVPQLQVEPDALVVEMLPPPPAPPPAVTPVAQPKLARVEQVLPKPFQVQPAISPPALRLPSLAAYTPPSAASAAGAPSNAPPSSGTSGAGSDSWDAQLVAHFQHNMRIPRGARAGRDQGVALLRFTVDRSGSVLSHRLERSSGSSLLDEEVEALVQRAAPLPRPPADLPGNSFERLIPLSFRVR